MVRRVSQPFGRFGINAFRPNLAKKYSHRQRNQQVWYQQYDGFHLPRRLDQSNDSVPGKMVSKDFCQTIRLMRHTLDT